MPISERINNWVEDRRKVWGEALGNFLLSSIAKGVTKSLEGIEPGAIDGIKPMLLKVHDNPDCPADVKALIDKVLTPGNPLIVVVGAVVLLLTMTGMLNALMSPVNRALEYKVDRGIESFRMDPNSIINAWRRDKEKYAWLFADLEEQGWSDKKIEALKFFTEVIPQAQDIIRFALREVYSPEIAEKYGQFQDIPTAAYTDAEKAGLPKDTFDKFWAAHWYLPSSSDGFEMLHRGIITEDELKALLKANDIMPYWRDQLIKISWNIPTRVDVRRFWDMRTIDEARLREVYTALGYHGKDLEDYVLWTKIFVDFPDLLARYKNGWITLDQVKSELIAMGMKPERADTMIEEKIKKAAPERLAEEKKLTKTEIYKGVKQEKITWDQGVELLMDLNYDVDEANYLLAINITAAAGSPESYAEFKDLTQKYRKASGLEGKPMNEEIRAAAQAVILITGERDSIQRSIRDEERKLIGEEILPAEATDRLNKLKTSLRKAEAALAAAKTEYDRLVAELKHGV